LDPIEVTQIQGASRARREKKTQTLHAVTCLVCMYVVYVYMYVHNPYSEEITL